MRDMSLGEGTIAALKVDSFVFDCMADRNVLLNGALAIRHVFWHPAPVDSVEFWAAMQFAMIGGAAPAPSCRRCKPHRTGMLNGVIAVSVRGIGMKTGVVARGQRPQLRIIAAQTHELRPEVANVAPEQGGRLVARATSELMCRSSLRSSAPQLQEQRHDPEANPRLHLMELPSTEPCPSLDICRIP
jgi:hypothetical protein